MKFGRVVLHRNLSSKLEFREDPRMDNHTLLKDDNETSYFVYFASEFHIIC
jgi:hypothetical protein